MRGAAALAGLMLLLCACSRKPAPATASAPASRTAGPPNITQFYATTPQLPRGEKELLCYGVENARSVWLSPPRQELTVSLTRCVEVTPSANTTYTLSAEGPGGPPATQTVTVEVGAPRVKIIEVQLNTLQLKHGDPLSICYKVENARSVEIAPIHFRGPSVSKGCTVDHPQKTTTYTVTAMGAAGDRDQEHVTVQVQ
jgi:hypothetical protein